jgi:hypothetical protein
MIPAQFNNFFLASAGAAGALVGLLFVAIAVDPTKTVMSSASIDRRAASSSAFGALVNAFFVSLGGLIPGTDIGGIALVMSCIGLVNSLVLCWYLLVRRQSWADARRRALLLLASYFLYGLELWSGVRLLMGIQDNSAINSLLYILLAIYGLGLVRAWELLGGQRYNLLGWFEMVTNHQDASSAPSDTPHETASASQRETR